jgi:F0F1-type ATP synthase membrane subunit c/vacuolar-type H+-ATPase subunit K
MLLLRINEIISPKILWLGFVAIIFIFSLVSFFLLYHWKRYLYKPEIIKHISRIYFIGAGIILIFMIIGLIMYTTL